VVDVYQQQSDLDNPRALAALFNLGDLRFVLGDAVAAERLFRDVLERQRRVLGTEHPTTLRTSSTAAETILAQGRLADAAEQFRSSRAVQQRILPASHPDIGATRKGLAEALVALSRPARLARFRVGNDLWHAADVRSLLGHALAKQGRFAEAEPLLTESYEEMATNPNPSRRLGQRAALQRVVELYDAWQKPDVAQRWRDRATSIIRP
jgi:tetratricopeptide (TPR) repeat protein